MTRRYSKVFLMIPLVITFFIPISCARKVVKEGEKVVPEVAKPKEEKVVAKSAEDKPVFETRVPQAPEAEGAAPWAEEKAVTLTLVSGKGEQIKEEEANLKADIHFDFDKYSLKPKAREILADKAFWLKKNRNVKVYIEGHCDERGTNEYNLALGERRANSAKTYLISFGISPDRLITISYGEEMPLDSGNKEEAWAKNRRAHFVILSK
jgi:peptidoglycan-associated lipoprotein